MERAREPYFCPMMETEQHWGEAGSSSVRENRPCGIRLLLSVNLETQDKSSRENGQQSCIFFWALYTATFTVGFSGFWVNFSYVDDALFLEATHNVLGWA